MGLTYLTHVGLKWVEFGLGSNHPDPSAAPATNIFFSVNVDAVSASAHSFFSWPGMTLRDPPVHAPAQARVNSPSSCQPYPQMSNGSCLGVALPIAIALQPCLGYTQGYLTVLL